MESARSPVRTSQFAAFDIQRQLQFRMCAVHNSQPDQRPVWNCDPLPDHLYLAANCLSMTFGAQDTGGEYKHRLTESELPTHSHWLTGDTNHTGHSFAWGGAGKNVYLNVLAAGGNGTGNVANTVQNEWNHTAVTGGNALHNNVQPYQVIYAWRRTG